LSKALWQALRSALGNAFAAATAYSASFQQYRQVVVANTRMLRRLTKALLAAQPVPVVSVCSDELTAQVALCDAAPESKSISQLLRVDSALLEQGVRPSPRASLEVLAQLLPQVAMERAAELLTELMAANARLRVEFRYVDEYVALTTALQDVQVRQDFTVVLCRDSLPTSPSAQARLDGLLDRDKWLKDLTKLCATWNLGMNDTSWRSMVQSASEQSRRLKDTVASLEEKADFNTARFAREIEAAVPKLRSAIAEVG